MKKKGKKLEDLETTIKVLESTMRLLKKVDSIIKMMKKELHRSEGENNE